MSVNKLTLSYPDFQLHNIIDPDQIDMNNADIKQKVDEIIDMINAMTSGAPIESSNLTQRIRDLETALTSHSSNRQNPHGVTSGQINIISDNRPPSHLPSNYAQGIHSFYCSGNSHGTIVKQWLDSVGAKASEYGRDISELRIYVTTTVSIGGTANTSIQRMVVFDWSSARAYQKYASFERTSNAPNAWGEWQPDVFVVEEGSNSNGRYVRYSDGTQTCVCAPVSTKVETPSGAIFRSETINIPFPASFVTAKPRHCSVEVSSEVRWAGTTGVGTATSIGVRQFSSVSSSSNFSARVMVQGWWK